MATRLLMRLATSSSETTVRSSILARVCSDLMLALYSSVSPPTARTARTSRSTLARSLPSLFSRACATVLATVTSFAPSSADLPLDAVLTMSLSAVIAPSNFVNAATCLDVSVSVPLGTCFLYAVSTSAALSWLSTILWVTRFLTSSSETTVRSSMLANFLRRWTLSCLL